jgi:hypothetical protein
MYDHRAVGGIEMDVTLVLIVLFAGYLVATYNRLQRMWHAVREGFANVDVGAGLQAELASRMAERSGDHPQVAARLAEVEQDLLMRRGRCNAAITAYNAYRAQIPQVMLSTLAGFRPIEFPASDRAAASDRTAPPPPTAEIVVLDVPGLRAVPDPAIRPWPQRPDAENVERRPPRS